MFLLRDYRLIVASRKFDGLKTIFVSRAYMAVLRKSIVPLTFFPNKNHRDWHFQFPAHQFNLYIMAKS